MNEQGARPTGHEDDWWRQLYDDSTGDTGPAPARDSLDDRFASASRTLTPGTTREGPAADPRPRRDRPADPTTPPRTPPAPPPPDTPAASTPAAPSVPSTPTTPSVPRQTPRPPAPTTDPGTSTSPLTPDPRPATPGPAPSPYDTVPGPTPYAAGDDPSAHHAPALSTAGPAAFAYDAGPGVLADAEPDALAELVPDTVLDGARYGTWTLRAVSTRGEAARLRGGPRGDFLLTARFGTGAHALVLVAMATGAPGTPDAHRAAAEACHLIGRAVGRSRARLAQDLRAARRGDLKSGLHRLTDRALGMLRASAAGRDLDPAAYTASLRCLLLPADPECRTRVFFGVGEGGLFRLREGRWQDIEPGAPGTQDGDPPTPGPGAPAPPPTPFRFRASVALPGDTLLMCTAGLAGPLRGVPGPAAYLRERWAAAPPPGLAGFLADIQVRAGDRTGDRTAAAVWEA